MKSPYGPQHKADNSFTKRMRFHQSWYREKVLGVPFGKVPGPKSSRKLGSMLERDGGKTGRNFLTPQIFEEVKKRLSKMRGVVEEYRLKHNMLSSQPMCFNLFAPLVHNQELAARVLGGLLPGKEVKKIGVDIEYAPEPRKEYLDDATAFDAFIEYERPDGKRGFVGMETKLTEPFSPKRYRGEKYRRWCRKPKAPWLEGAPDELVKIRYNQLWRDHLLAAAMLLRDESPYAEGYFMLVRHPLDRHCEETVRRYRELLKPGDRTFIDCPLDRLVAVMEGAVRGLDQESWLSEFKKRYLDLELSEGAWEQFKDHS